MGETNLKNLKEQLKEHGIRPLKRLGQNFLINEKAADKFIEALELSKEDIVIEVGSGTGFLTKKLSQKAKKVIAIEKDEKMVEVSKGSIGNIKNIKLIKGDILKEDIDKEISKLKSYKLCGNIPYYITSVLIRRFLECKRKPESIILIIQKELAQRITAHPPKMSMLAVSVQFYAKPKIITYISKKNFWPSPKVDSAILKISDISSEISENYRNSFFKLVKAGFSHPRKKILNNLPKVLKLDKEETRLRFIKSDIDSGRRAETLSIDEWKKLTKSFKNYLLF